MTDENGDGEDGKRGWGGTWISFGSEAERVQDGRDSESHHHGSNC